MVNLSFKLRNTAAKAEHRKSNWFVLVFVLMVMLVNVPVQAQDSDEKHLTVALRELLSSFDYIYDWSLAGVWIQSNVGDCLIWRDRETAEYVPWLAESWQNIDDTTWQITLRQGVEFHNGEPFNATAAKYTIDRIQNDEQALVHRQWAFIDEVRIIDDYTIEVVTVSPEPSFLNKMAGTGCQVVPPVYTEEVGSEGFSQQPIGTGPFRFVEWARDERVILEANPDYFRGRPQIDILEFRPIPEDFTRVAELLTGGVDMIVSPPPQDWERIEAQPELAIDRFLTNFVMHLELRAGPSSTYPEWEGPTSDPRIRQAISYAIDRETILEVIDGMGYPTQTRVIPPMLGVHPDLYGSSGQYNPERARELMAEAGYDGEPIVIQSSTLFLLQREISEVVGAMLEAVGFEVDLQVMDITSFRERVYFTYRNDEIYFMATKNTFQDPWITMLGYQSDRGERVGWTGPEAEEVDLLARAAAVNMDPEERAAQYRRIQELILAENGGPLLTLYQMNDAMGRRANVVYQHAPDGWLWFGEARIE
jgi:peptide/nickel transport system substrate-binding protein